MKANQYNNRTIYHLDFFCLIIILVLFYVDCQNEKDYNIAVLPFQSFLPKKNSPDTNIALISSWIYRMLYLNIKVESGQNISMILNYDQPQIHTNHMAAYFKDLEGSDERYVTDISEICSFNYKASNTYKLLTNFNYTFYSKPYSCYASESIILYRDINLKQTSINEIKFVHSSNDTQNCFCAGLIESESLMEKIHSLYYQFKQLINSKSFTWSLSFTRPNEGKFIFGDIINNTNIPFNNNNDRDNFISILQNPYSSYRIHYQIKIDKIYVGNYINDTATSFQIDIHKRYITVSKDLYIKIKELYMLDTSTEKDMCKEVNPDKFFYTIYCNKKKYLEHTDNYKKLKNLKFFYNPDKYNFTFTPQELFLENDDYIYFFIGYGVKYVKDEDDYESIYNTFTLGSIFLEKYTTVFDDEAKLLHILTDKETKEANEESYTLKIVLIVVLSFILCAGIFVIIGKLYGKQLFGGRKKKANELIDDEYDYSPKDINNEEKKEGLFKESEENGNENGA